jgi:hypothetical protein
MRETVVTPTESLKSILLEAYEPCRFFDQCREACWAPTEGQIPRGFLGATGTAEEVEVIMVFSEPGHPHEEETYIETLDARELISACTSYVYDCFKNGTDQFHKNARWFISQLYPNMSFDEQLKSVWLTEGRLCSINVEIGRTTDHTCAINYLSRQIERLPNATVVAFGNKAKHYLKKINVDFIGAYALAPPGANHKPARPSWEAAIAEVRRRRQFRS